DHRVPAQNEADDSSHVGLAYRLAHRAQVTLGGGDRLLDQHVFSGACRGNGLLRVAGRRGTDLNRVEAGGPAQRVHVVVQADARRVESDLTRLRRGALFRATPDGHHAATRIHEIRLQVLRRDRARPLNGYTDGIIELHGIYSGP